MKTASFLMVAAVITATVLGAARHAASADAEPITIMTFNVRFDCVRDGEDRWSQRKDMVRDMLQRVAADFVGMQEAMENQMAYLREQLPEYAFLVRSRETEAKVGEACPLFYRADRWQLDPKEQGFFWLSETPEVPGSRSWDTACPRVTTWGRFIDKKTGRGLYVYNTHLDHVSEAARQNGAQLLAERIAALKA